MTDQPDLLGWEPPVKAPFVASSQTSADAAEKIAPHIGPLHKRLLAFLAAHPEGQTDEQMQLGMEMSPSTQRPRRIEMLRADRVRDSGRTALTKSGRAAVVWCLKHGGGR